VASVYIAALIKYFGDDETKILVEINEPPKPPIIKHSKNLPYDCIVPEYLIKNINRIITSPPQNINLITSKYSNTKFMEFEIIRKFFKTFPDLKKKSIQRSDVSELFRKKQYYLGFITAMIWGGINASRPKKKDDFETIGFYTLLKQDENKITTIIHHVKSLLVKEEHLNCFNYLNKEGKIKGVGHAYFTKLMYFIGYIDKRIKLKPLIFDKWTSNAYLALLINSNQLDKVKQFYTGKIDNKNKIVSLRSNTALTYENYIKDDRNNFFLDKPNKLYLYVNLNGNPTNLDAIPSVNIYDPNGDIFSAYTSSSVTHVTLGVYSVDIIVPTTASNLETMYNDVWTGLTINGVTRPDITLDFVLDERARELYWEGHRRQDLIRFGKYTGSSYLWQWKGNSQSGTGIDDKLKLFPIPAQAIGSNPTLQQNSGY
jgi:hypothetical protein